MKIERDYEDYILYVGKKEKPNEQEIEITEERYNEVLNKLNNKPTAPEGYFYKLHINLEWELIKVEETNIPIEENEII